jgi:hypothetical protein
MDRLAFFHILERLKVRMVSGFITIYIAGPLTFTGYHK